MKKANKKLKTKRGAMKRFKVTGTGKVRFRRANRSHYNTKRTTKQMRQGRSNGVMAPGDAKLAHRLMLTEGK